ncbi:unnamed protein product [Cyprideis torosa]|uniref:Uncharacterized protein n=1 Tax=Cyprideis torosa TaxID=163714 RepID=A0A7R8WI58_9CRUS|nr:unnamed protein product [Cyprideis torosa]CAG0900290.1 unnamed protein product [Cyprideis torosa]
MYRHMSLRTDDPPRNYAEVKKSLPDVIGIIPADLLIPLSSDRNRESSGFLKGTASSPYRSILNKGILQLRGDGTLGLLEEKWFGGQHQECEQDAIESFMEGLSSIGLYNFGPAFLVVIVGLFIALLVAVCELCVYSRQKSRQELRPLSHQFKDELQDSIRLKPQTTNHPPGLSPMAPQPGLQMQPLQTPISTTAPPMNPQQTPSPAMMPMNSPYHHSAPHHYPPGANPTQPGIGGQKPLPPFPNSYQGLS